MAEYQVSQIYEGLKESDLYILTEFLKMLGNPTRIRILLLLMEQDTNVSNLAEQLGMTQSAVSHQLNLLNVTALDGEEDQIKGLDLQADDYITKPFSMPVLLRKIAAVLRRGSKTEQTPRTLTHKDLTLDLDGYRTYAGGRKHRPYPPLGNLKSCGSCCSTEAGY